MTKTLLIIILSAISYSSNAQTRLSDVGLTKQSMAHCFMVTGDTLQITDHKGFKYIKIGDKTYEITSPELKEVWPVLSIQYGKGGYGFPLNGIPFTYGTIQVDTTIYQLKKPKKNINK